MASAESYVQESWQLVCGVFPEGKIAVRWSTPAEARAQKRVLTQLQKELRLVKKRLAVDKRLISAAFTSRRIMIGKGFGAGLAAGFVGRRNLGMLNAARRNDVRVQQLQAAAPFDQAAHKIDAVLAQLDGFKNEIDRKLLEPSGSNPQLPA